MPSSKTQQGSSAALKEQELWFKREGDRKKKNNERISSGSGSAHQNLLKEQIIFVHAEKMPPGNPMPTMLRLPSVTKPPRQEVAFDSTLMSFAPNHSASPMYYKTINSVKHLPWQSPHMLMQCQTMISLLATEDYLSKLRRHLVFIKILGWKAIKYIWCLTFKCSCSPLYLF